MASYILKDLHEFVSVICQRLRSSVQGSLLSSVSGDIDGVCECVCVPFCAHSHPPILTIDKHYVCCTFSFIGILMKATFLCAFLFCKFLLMALSIHFVSVFTLSAEYTPHLSALPFARCSMIPSPFYQAAHHIASRLPNTHNDHMAPLISVSPHIDLHCNFMGYKPRAGFSR